MAASRQHIRAEGRGNWLSQIRSRERVQGLAEVYTHEREVGEMLDLVARMLPSEGDPGDTDRLFLEPACGHGNFLVEILKRKLRFVTRGRYGGGERLEHRVLRCLASIYGIDISKDNVEEARGRLLGVISVHVEREIGAGVASAGFESAVDVILVSNVVCADALADAAAIELIEYRPASGGCFVREWSRPLDPAADEPSLFAPRVVRDQVPVHYSRLACQEAPARADFLEPEAA